MMKKLAMAAVSLLAVGCGPSDDDGDGIADGIRDPNNISVVVPSTPRGTVSGQVLTTQQRPLSGATVTMTIGSTPSAASVNTDDSGNFTFQNVPGGAEVLLTFSKDGFSSLRATSIVPTSAGNVPINNGNASFGPVLLSELNGSLKVYVFSPDGRPAAGAQGTLEVDPAGKVLFGASERTTSTVVVEATADAQGLLTFERVPRPAELQRLQGEYRLSVAALDVNNDGVFEAGGKVVTYSGQALLESGTQRTESLPYAYTPEASLGISHSSIASLKGGSKDPIFNMVRSGEGVSIVFNQPVQPTSIIAGLTDEYSGQLLNFTKSVSGGGTVLIIQPEVPFQPGKEYNLALRAVALNGSATGATQFNNTVSFFGGDLFQPQFTTIESVQFRDVKPGVGYVNGLLDPNEQVYIHFNHVLSRYGTQPAFVFFNADLDGNGTVGNAVGEVGNKTGFSLLADEPLAPVVTRTPAEEPVFSIAASGFTTRHSFRFTGSKSLDPAAFPGGLPVVVSFSGIKDPSRNGYANAWGVTLVSDMTAALFNTGAIPPLP
ncbi:carboxypeptidase-like regulatory domain-containing protein [Stigmatella sp. ncwal1]|uniref:Carboxypeptidase-like regulatory domain-containing protein n=1 Tax=Stigmatella ashevillensis TaxID=2995309 RepID=A0ABT5DC44_9BACT|nr:carboxypeptidase-like regulatory domain-containing protein [Stigmatella ashevillena]MDC0711184.1 carboxypeptidase-like regulatory domain-containing protein [Stigmatella ashevillena]